MPPPALRVFLARLLEFILRRRRDARLDAEIDAHLDELTEHYVARGLSSGDARLAARRAFGSVDGMKTIYREQRGLPAIDGLIADARFAARLFAKDRWFAAGAVLVLALGLGVNTTVFTMVNGMNLRGLPVVRGDQIVMIDSLELQGRRRGMSTSYADFRDWQSTTQTFSGLAAYAPSTMNVGDADRPADRLAGFFISAGAFRLLQISPALGRDLTADDERVGAAPVVMIAHHVWTSRYGADPAIVGRVVRVNGTPATIVGVMPARFRFPVLADVWQPIALSPGFGAQTRGDRTFFVFGRLKDAVTLEQARAELATVAAGLSAQYPETNEAIGVKVVPFTEAYVGRATEGPPMILMIAGVLVLLVVFANTTNMLLGRAAHRGREIAVRAALGASRTRIVQQLLVESAMLAVLAGMVGFLFAVVAMRFFAAEAADLNLPYWIRFDFDARVFAFVTAICLGTAVIVGLAPAWQLSRSQAHEALKDAGRGTAGSVRGRRWGSGLLIAELALTLALLAGASLLMQSGMALYHADARITVPGVLTAQLAIPAGKYTTPDQRRALHSRVQEHLDETPTIQSASLASARPFVDAVGMRLVVEGESRSAADAPVVQMVAVGDRYFETLALRMLRGRAFGPQDGSPGQDVVIVNERFASLHFPDVDPVGRRIQLAEGRSGADRGPWLTIVGVSPSVRQRPMGPAAAVAYLPLRARPGPFTSLVLRSSADSALVASTLREQLRYIDPDLAAYNVEPLKRLSEKSRWNHRVMSTVLAMLAAIATLLSAAGLYAVVAHGVAHRTSEIGIRMALGARRSQVAWLFLRRTFVQTGIGLSLGLVGAYAVGQLIRSLLIETSPTDPLTLAAVVLLLVLVAGAACFVPVRRAVRLDPVAALRHE